MSGSELAYVRPLDEGNHRGTGNESADMRAPGDATTARPNHQRFDRLEHDPEAQRPDRREPHQTRIEPERWQHQHARVWRQNR